MLVLSRKVGQSIVIGDQIVLTIVRLGRGSVQIGVEAPPHVRILRQEVMERMLESGELDDDRWFAETGQRVGAR
jgi:carbon storage regulator CsrA